MLSVTKIYRSGYATTTPTTLELRPIGVWHIGHGIDAASMPKSHSAHTARWLHSTYNTPRSRSMHTTQK